MGSRNLDLARRARFVRVVIVVATLIGIARAVPARADVPTDAAFLNTWDRTDKPVADGLANRTWMWGPQADTPKMSEPYAEGQAGGRIVQYYDKSRMEIATDPNVDPRSVWFVTNGLLVTELVTGRLQVGDGTFEDRAPAWINVAGDDDDPLGPTYATFATLLGASPGDAGTPLTATLNRYGVIGDDPGLTRYGASAAYRVTLSGIDHTVASPFWDFMNSAGTIWDDGAYRDGALFVNPFYATGYPISEAYWSRVAVAGARVDVLIQCFERRCLTYTPGNPEGWKVEAGNVGRHYYAWRYTDWPGDPQGSGETVFSSSLSDFASFSGTNGSGAWDGSSYVIDAPGGSAAASTELFVHATADDYVPPAGGEVVSLAVRITDGGLETFACLTGGYASDDHGSRRYALCIDGYNTVSAVWETFTPLGVAVEYEPLLEFTASAGLSASSQWNTLQITSVGDQLWFFVNGDLVGTTHHSGVASGPAGLYLVNDGTSPASAEFRDLTVNLLADS